MADGMTHMMSDRIAMVRDDIDKLQRLALELENEVSKLRWNEKAREERVVEPDEQAVASGSVTGIDLMIEAAIRAGMRLSEDLNTHNEAASIQSVIAALLALSAAWQEGPSCTKA
ncbi:hypothetical protein AWH62_00825 [Maricaulis sp. W15]|uniref:hypothetical protein n=1 Tax=Maricaulis sp. W15 TaxID=1772333 RepID=UPI0009488F36|nr:hypothetical protein [Maricaulis sp. W15]OLF81250.1 hypothetical protein AWH62_00825 [Maricaulis sp. W15]